jgi:hypothetical protein
MLRKRRIRRRSRAAPLGLALVAALALCSLALPTAGLAAPPRVQQYGNPMATEQAPTPTTPTSQGSGGGGSGLPFTGLDLTVVLAAGASFVLAGYLVRRSGRAREN